MIRLLLMLAGLALVFQEPETEEDHEFQMSGGGTARTSPPPPDPFVVLGWLLLLVALLGFAFTLALIVETSPRPLP